MTTVLSAAMIIVFRTGPSLAPIIIIIPHGGAQKQLTSKAVVWFNAALTAVVELTVRLRAGSADRCRKPTKSSRTILLIMSRNAATCGAWLTRRVTFSIAERPFAGN